MEAVKRKIALSTAEEARELLDAILSRYSQLYPDWDIGTISVQKSRNRNQQLDETIRILQSLKDSR